MAVDLADAQEILSRTPAVLRTLLGGLSDGWAGFRPEGGWSAIEIVGHLVHGEETDWIPRARIILEHGESVPFEPFDREGFREIVRGAELRDLLDTFDRLRRENVATLGDLHPGDRLDLRGTHPELGTVTMGELIATWAAHDLVHLGHAAEVLGKRYRGEVGPWIAYLPALERD